jgi:hypothetical protein
VTKNLESPARAEEMQRRKAAYLPRVWPVVLILAAIIAVAIWH